MKINNNTDQATQKLNKMHSENCQTSKTELSLGNSQQLNSASCFRKMLPFGCLTEPQVRKIGDITDNKRTSKLTKRIQKSGKHSSRRSQQLKSANLTQKTPPQTFKRVLDTSLDYIVLSVEQFQRN